MLFWIFVIIAVIAAVAFAIVSTPSKDYTELKRLEKVKDAAEKAWVFADISLKADSFYAIAKKRSIEADKALYKFKQEHPDLKKKEENRELSATIVGGILIGVAIIILIMLMALMIIYLDAPANHARLQAEYDAISWEVANDVYANDDDVIGRKELYNQVREWNKNLVAKQAKEKNFWLGIFVPDIYEDLKPIELK